MEGVIAFLVLNDKILSPHMKQLSEHIDITYQNINSFGQTSKIIVDLSHNKGVRNEDSYSKLTDIQN